MAKKIMAIFLSVALVFGLTGGMTNGNGSPGVTAATTADKNIVISRSSNVTASDVSEASSALKVQSKQTVLAFVNTKKAKKVLKVLKKTKGEAVLKLKKGKKETYLTSGTYNKMIKSWMKKTGKKPGKVIEIRVYTGVQFVDSGKVPTVENIKKFGGTVGSSEWNAGPYQKIISVNGGKTFIRAGNNKGAGACGNPVILPKKFPKLKLTWRNVTMTKTSAQAKSKTVWRCTVTAEAKVTANAQVQGHCEHANCTEVHVSGSASATGTAYGYASASMTLTAISSAEAKTKAKKRGWSKVKLQALASGGAMAKVKAEATAQAKLDLVCDWQPPKPAPTPVPVDHPPVVTVGDLACLHLLHKGNVEIVAYDDDGDNIVVSKVLMNENGTAAVPKLQSSTILPDGSRRSVWSVEVTAQKVGLASIAVQVTANGKSSVSNTSYIEVVEDEGEAVWGPPNLD
jgi:hypothetical protein